MNVKYFYFLGTEEMAHEEILSAIIRQLTDGLSASEIEKGGFAPFYIDHTGGIYPTDSNGVPYTVTTFQSKGDPITDLHEDLAADATTAKEQPTISRGWKPLILLGFRHFEGFRKNGIPATI